MPGDLRDEGSRRRAPLGVVIGAALAVCLPATLAAAENITGGSAGEKLTGTKGADEIRGRGGADTVKGRGGKDLLDGGGGNDTIKAGDRRRDRKISGGTGIDACEIDALLELARVRSCETIRNVGGVNGRGPGPGKGLRLGIADGLGCSPSRADCRFNIQGDGADAVGGDVTGVGGVGSLSGVALAVIPPENDDWVSAGSYRCSGPGFLRVTIGAETLDVPVSCA